MRNRQFLPALATLLLAATVHAVPVHFDVDSHYSAPSYRGSFLHGATGCNGLHAELYMCGSFLDRITSGYINGDLSGGVLTITGGELNTVNDTVVLTGGTIGGAFTWFIETASHGLFEYVDLSAIPGSPYTAGNQPNSLTQSGSTVTMVLWGQNRHSPTLSGFDAARFDPGIEKMGMDLVAVARVPEPTVLVLFLIGIAALAYLRTARAERQPVHPETTD